MRLRKEQQLLNDEHLQARWGIAWRFHYSGPGWHSSSVIHAYIWFFQQKSKGSLISIISNGDNNFRQFIKILSIVTVSSRILSYRQPNFIWGMRIESKSLLKDNGSVFQLLLFWGQFQVTNKPDKLGFNTKPTQETKSNKPRIRSNHFIEYLRTINVYLTW